MKKHSSLQKFKTFFLSKTFFIILAFILLVGLITFLIANLTSVGKELFRGLVVDISKEAVIKFDIQGFEKLNLIR